MLVLDALFAGDPVAACREVGAEGCFAYVWRPGGIGDWSAAKVSALRAAGLATAPIFVPPGDGSGSWGEILAGATSLGFRPGPIIGDLEGPFNLPPPAWWSQLCQEAGLAGWRPYLYGNGGDVGAYPRGEGWWQARYVQQTVQPVPQLPSGLKGWQYANDVPILGRTYDCSVVLPELIGGAMALDPNDPIVQEIRGRLGWIENQLIYGADTPINGQQVHTRIGLIADLFNLTAYGKLGTLQSSGDAKLDQVLADLKAGAGGGVSAAALADALEAQAAKLRAG